jgi:hypothetical protein
MIAVRRWLDSTGAETSDEMAATAFEYEWRDGGQKFTCDVSKLPQQALYSLAIFGGLTKAGNIVNTWISDTSWRDKRDAGEDTTSVGDPIGDVDAWFGNLVDGQWGEERVGGPGARFNKEALAKALASVDPQGRSEAEFRARLDANEKRTEGKRQILYGTWVLKNDVVRAAYEKIVPPANKPTLDAI